MTTPEDLATRWRQAVLEVHDGAARPARAHNRLATRCHSLGEELATHGTGRELLTRAATTDPDPNVRLVAAGHVAVWDDGTARAVYESLVTAAGGEVVRPMTMAAALAVRDHVGWTAGLCLYDLDEVRGRPAPDPRPTADVALDDDTLADADRVLDLAHNGGLDHAYELVGDRFPAAASVFDAVGAVRAAAVLRELRQLLGDTGATATGDERAARLAALGEVDGARLDGLVGEFGDLASDAGDRLDRAAG